VDEALALAQQADDAAAWRSILLAFGPELAVLPGGLRRSQVIARQVVVSADDEAGRWALLAQRGTAAWLQGRLDDTLEAYRQVLALTPSQAAAWTPVLNDLVGFAISAHTARRDYDRARQTLDAELTRLQHIGTDPLPEASLWFRRARLDWLRGVGASSGSLAQARQLWAALPSHPWTSVLLPTLAGLSASATGQLDLSEQHLREASRLEAAAPTVVLLARPTLLLAQVLHAQRQVEPALDILAPVLETCRREGTPGLVVQEGAALIPLLRLASQQGRSGPAAAEVLSLLGVSNVTRRLLLPETGLVLSPREVDVLELLAADASNRLIAERLDVDITTVKSHVTRVLAKLGVATRYEAAERARAMGLGNGR